MFESSLHFWQASLKIFKQINCATGQLHCGKHEDSLIKKLRKKAQPKSTRHYIDLNKKAKSEKGLTEWSWISSKYTFLLGNCFIFKILEIVLKNETEINSISSNSSSSQTSSFKMKKEKKSSPEKQIVSQEPKVFSLVILEFFSLRFESSLSHFLFLINLMNLFF